MLHRRCGHGAFSRPATRPCAHAPARDRPAGLATQSGAAAELHPDSLLPTHFGPVEVDTYTHLQDVEDRLAAAAAFVRGFWQEGVSTDAIIEAFKPWISEQALADGVNSDAERFEVIVPSEMCVQGFVRHYQKARRGEFLRDWKSRPEIEKWPQPLAERRSGATTPTFRSR